MDQDPVRDASGEAVQGTRPVVRPPRKYPTGTRLLVGSIFSFVVASVLYGPTIVMQMIFFATVCTIGIGLLLILAGCWLVGWVLLEVWSAINTPDREPSQS